MKNDLGVYDYMISIIGGIVGGLLALLIGRLFI